MKKMKRVLVALLSCLTAFACLAGTVACGDDKKPTTGNNNQSESSVDSSSKDDASKEEAKPVGGCNGECNFEHVAELLPTCTEDGRAATVQCTECGYIVDPAPALLEKSAYACEAEYLLAKEAYIRYWSVYAKYGDEHEWSEEETEYVAPTCCTDGVKSYRTCTICGVKNIENTVIPATGEHTKEDFVEYTHAIPATCTEDGRTEGWVCKNGGVKEVEIIPALGHDEVYDEEDENYIGSKAPTCLTDAVCGRCDEDLEDTKLGHSYVSVDAKAATCLEAGWEAYEYCDREGCAHTTFNFEAAAEMTAAKHWEAQKKAENFTEVEKVVATCTNAGNNKYFVCNDCNLIRDSKNATKNITATLEENVVYKAQLPHVLDTKAEDYVKLEVATCEVDGKAASGTCKNCENYVDGEVLPATGHSFEGENAVINANSYPASCTKDAKCSNAKCDYKNGKIEDTAFGHTWVEVEDYFVSCTENGIRAHVECETCGAWALENAEETEKKNDGWVDGYKEAASNNSVYVLKALGHGYNNNWVKVEAKAATHAEAGWNEYYVCGICEDYKKDYVELPAIAGHNCPDFGIDTCSRYFVCEDIVDEEGNVTFYGCGIIFDNPNYIPCVDADDDGICDVCKNVACTHPNMWNGYCDDCHYCEHIAHTQAGVCYECGAKVEHEYADVTFACICGLVCAHTQDHNQDLTCEDCGYVIPGETHTYDATFVCTECGVACQHEAGFDADDKCIACGKECKHESHIYETMACEVCGKVVAHNWVRDEEDGSDYCALCGVTCSHETHDATGICTDLCGNVVDHTWNLTSDVEGMAQCSVCAAYASLQSVCPHEEHIMIAATGSDAAYTQCKLCKMNNVAHIWTADNGADIKCHCGETWKKGTVISRGELTLDTDISINVADQDNNSFAIKTQGEDTVVTIAGGSYDGGSASKSNIAIWADDKSTVVISDGEFKVGVDKNGEANPTIYASNGATIVIEDGTFYGVAGDGRVWTLNCQDNTGAKIIVKGGKFYGFNPADCGVDPVNPTNYVAEGYKVVEGEDSEGKFWAVVEAE